MNKVFKEWLITTTSFAVGGIISVVFFNCSASTGIFTTSLLSIGYGWALLKNYKKINKEEI